MILQRWDEFDKVRNRLPLAVLEVLFYFASRIAPNVLGRLHAPDPMFREPPSATVNRNDAFANKRTKKAYKTFALASRKSLSIAVDVAIHPPDAFQVKFQMHYVSVRELFHQLLCSRAPPLRYRWIVNWRLRHRLNLL
jgi:hypothetical protein